MNMDMGGGNHMGRDMGEAARIIGSGAARTLDNNNNNNDVGCDVHERGTGFTAQHQGTCRGALKAVNPRIPDAAHRRPATPHPITGASGPMKMVGAARILGAARTLDNNNSYSGQKQQLLWTRTTTRCWVWRAWEGNGVYRAASGHMRGFNALKALKVFFQKTLSLGRHV